MVSNGTGIGDSTRPFPTRHASKQLMQVTKLKNSAGRLDRSGDREQRQNENQGQKPEVDVGVRLQPNQRCQEYPHALPTVLLAVVLLSFRHALRCRKSSSYVIAVDLFCV